jgi:hypothetical protein
MVPGEEGGGVGVFGLPNVLDKVEGQTLGRSIVAPNIEAEAQLIWCDNIGLAQDKHFFSFAVAATISVEN